MRLNAASDMPCWAGGAAEGAAQCERYGAADFQGPETRLEQRLRDKYVKMGKGRGVGDAPAMHNRRHRVTPCSSRLLQADSVRWCALQTNQRLSEKA